MQMKHLVIATLAGILILSLVACSGANSTSDDPLDGTSWALMAYRKSSPIPETTLTATFKDGKIHGSAGCNSYSGPYQIGDGTITIGAIASTEMACLEPEGIMEQETMFLNEFLRKAQTFRFADEQLQIFRADGEALTFVPQD